MKHVFQTNLKLASLLGFVTLHVLHVAINASPNHYSVYILDGSLINQNEVWEPSLSQPKSDVFQARENYHCDYLSRAVASMFPISFQCFIDSFNNTVEAVKINYKFFIASEETNSWKIETDFSVGLSINPGRDLLKSFKSEDQNLFQIEKFSGNLSVDSCLEISLISSNISTENRDYNFEFCPPDMIKMVTTTPPVLTGKITYFIYLVTSKLKAQHETWDYRLDLNSTKYFKQKSNFYCSKLLNSLQLQNKYRDANCRIDNFLSDSEEVVVSKNLLVNLKSKQVVNFVSVGYTSFIASIRANLNEFLEEYTAVVKSQSNTKFLSEFGIEHDFQKQVF